MVSTVWDDEVVTIVDRGSGATRISQPSALARGYISELDHSSPFAQPMISGELALAPTLPDVLASVPPPPPPRRAATRTQHQPQASYRGPLPGRLAPVIPMPGVPAPPTPVRGKRSAVQAPQPQRGRSVEAHAPPSKGALPLLAINQRPLPREHARCQTHGHQGEMLCVSCDTPLCPKCEYLLINDRPWCLSCGKPYRPTLLSALFQAVRILARVTLLLATVFATVFYAPIPLGARAVVALLLGLILAWFLFLSDRHEVNVMVVDPRRAKRRSAR